MHSHDVLLTMNAVETELIAQLYLLNFSSVQKKCTVANSSFWIRIQLKQIARITGKLIARRYATKFDHIARPVTVA